MITLIKRILEEIQHWLLPIFILLVFLGLLLCAKCGIIEAGNYSEMLQALFAFLGIGGLIYTLDNQNEILKAQQEALKTQKEELKTQQKSLDTQKREFQEQAKIQRKEDVKNRFFKMLDYHNEIVSQISVIHYTDRGEKENIQGRQAFVAYKKQLKELYKLVVGIIPYNSDNNIADLNEVIMGVVYLIFYYGFDIRWSESLKEELNKYLYGKTTAGSNRENILGINGEEIINRLKLQSKDKHAKNLLRTNQTYISAYFKNMYNAIKLVDSDNTLTNVEKRELVKLLRAQLSYTEVYVLFYSLFTRFGDKWRESKYIKRYKFIKNISKVDLDLDKVREDLKNSKGEIIARNGSEGINPRYYFDIEYDDNFPDPQQQNTFLYY